MKKIFGIFAITSILLFCTTKKKSTGSDTASNTKNESSAPVGGRTAKAPATDAEILGFAQKRWASATKEELEEGKAIFEGPCTGCHEKQSIVMRDEKSWLHEIDKMSPKAKLTAEQKTKLTHYILAFRDANTNY